MDQLHLVYPKFEQIQGSLHLLANKDSGKRKAFSV